MTALRRSARALLGSAALGLAAAAGAQAPAHAPVDGERILRLLVAKGVITQGDADGIVAEAGAAPPVAAATAPPVVAGGVNGDTQTIPYIPQTVRDQIKTQIETEMAARTEKEGWARPGEVAEWTKRIRLYGDVRIRGEGDLFGNRNDRDIPNFSAINAGAPYDINTNTNLVPVPVLDTSRDRERPRIRARIGIDAQVTDWILAQVRGATGNDTSPVSTNQTLGGGNGDFSKYSIWLDRANIQITPHGRLDGARLVLGRAENPFWTTELIFDNDLNFDGVSLGYKHPLGEKIGLFVAGGAFPTYNTDFNFGSRYTGAFRSRDRWLLAGQAGASYAIADNVKVTAGAGYFDFTSARGKVSSPCLFNQDTCETDNTRPLFQQYGNSVFPIRTIVPNPAAAPGFTPEPQYFGLASNFRILEARAALDFGASGRVPVRIEGEFIDNLGFHRGRVERIQSNVIGEYRPSGIGWFGNVIVGTPQPGKWGEWSAFGGYKRIGTDAMLDSLVDSDFHLGGTNAKGYIVGGAFGLGGNASLGLRWLSADEVTGQPYSVDVLQIDLNARF